MLSQEGTDQNISLAQQSQRDESDVNATVAEENVHSLVQVFPKEEDPVLMDLAEGENWLRLINPSGAGILEDESSQASLYPSVLSLVDLGRIDAPSQDLFICLDVSGELLTIKDFRDPNPVSSQEEQAAESKQDSERVSVDVLRPDKGGSSEPLARRRLTVLNNKDQLHISAMSQTVLILRCSYEAREDLTPSTNGFDNSQCVATQNVDCSSLPATQEESMLAVSKGPSKLIGLVVEEKKAHSSVRGTEGAGNGLQDDTSNTALATQASTTGKVSNRPTFSGIEPPIVDTSERAPPLSMLTDDEDNAAKSTQPSQSESHLSQLVAEPVSNQKEHTNKDSESCHKARLPGDDDESDDSTIVSEQDIARLQSTTTYANSASLLHSTADASQESSTTTKAEADGGGKPRAASQRNIENLKDESSFTERDSNELPVSQSPDTRILANLPSKDLTSCFTSSSTVQGNNESTKTTVVAEHKSRQSTTGKRGNPKSGSEQSTKRQRMAQDQNTKRSSPRCKTLPVQEKSVRILVTGITVDSEIKSMVKKINAVLVERVEKAASATHAIVSGPNPARTIKLMVAMCCANCIVTLDWLRNSSAQGKVLKCDDYVALDARTFDRIQTMRKNEERLLSGVSVFVCTGISKKEAPPRAELKLLVEAAGGSWIDKSCESEGKSGVAITSAKTTKAQKTQLQALKGNLTPKTIAWLKEAVMKQKYSLDHR